MRLHNWSPPGISRRSRRAISLDIGAAWDWLVAQGYDLARIGIAGDSAGRTPCDHAAPELARAGTPLPAAVVALSPVIDFSLACGLARDRIEIERDPFAAALACATDPQARCRPRGPARRGPADHVRRPRIRGARFTVEHRVWPGQMHVFQAMSALMPGISCVALAEIAESVHRHLPIDPAGLPAAMEAIA